MSDASAVVALIPRLRAICGDEHVVTQHDELRTYASDGLLQYAVTPGVVVLPGSGEEVRDVVRACHEAAVPWVARGSGSGLSGGALPVEDGVLIGLSRLRAVLEVDLDNQRVVVEPGVTNVEVSAAVGPTHFYPPDPSSQIVCSIGGNVAENSGGAHCFKYGFTTNYVTGLEVVLADGEVVQVGRQGARPARLRPARRVGGLGGHARRWSPRSRCAWCPRPSTSRRMVAFFESTSDAGEVVSEIVSAGITPAAIEMMDGLAIQASEQMAHAGYPLDAGACLLIELDGPHEECARAPGRGHRRCASATAAATCAWPRTSPSASSCGRRARPPSRPRPASRPHYFVQDGVIPRTRLPEVLRRIDALAAEYGMQVANVFHAGDGNLHPLVCYDGRRRAPRAPRSSPGAILDACVELGGSLTGEHGDRRRQEGAHAEDVRRGRPATAFQRLRCAFDPGGLANPGKVMPTPRLCGEVPGPYREHPLERGRAGGALLVETVASRTETPGSAQEAAALLRAQRARAHPRRRHEARAGATSRPHPTWSLLTAGSTASSSTTRVTSPPCSRPACRCAAAQERFAAAGQMLALDPPRRAPSATIGGVVATGDSGPLRHRYGAARDLVVGITVALPDGTVAQAGGKVIKNVAGYDLAKLFTGSFGTLGLIAQVAVRLHPRPPRR